MKNAYQETIERIEVDIAPIHATAGWASIAISLRRIADALEQILEIKSEEQDAK